jgi:hypothetical protein
MATERDLSSYPGMTKWFSPRLLVWAAYRDVAARIFGEFADRRTTQHLADPIPADPAQRKAFAERYDYSARAQPNEPFWVDFAADLGDGFDSTYAIAYLLSADRLTGKGPAKEGIEGIRGLPSGQELPHGHLLLFGGDQIYPWPAREAYDESTFAPYEMALPQSPTAPRRDVFAIPGNHDWYDGLNAFDDQFCRARAGRSQRLGRQFGNFQTCQHRSSFAIKLPHNWWIWGADIQLNDVLDSGQLDYFTTVADCMGKDDKFILLTAEPSWYEIETLQGQAAANNLRELIRAPIAKGAKLCGILTGDSHHYARYNEKDQLGNMNLITAGGGGAYVHGTYHLKQEIKFHWGARDLDFKLGRKLKPDDSAQDAIPKQTNHNACYPSKARSRLLALHALRFPGRNVSFWIAAGILYWLMTWTFANLKVDFWLEIPEGGKITRGLTQSPAAVRECLQPEADTVAKLRQSRAAQRDVKSCILGSTEKTFTGTGNVEEWTLQMVQFYFEDKTDRFIWKTWIAFWKGIHLLLLGIVNSILAAVFLFGVLVTFFIIAQSKRKRVLGLVSRGTQAFFHLSAHLAVMWGLYSGLAYLNYTYADKLAGLVAKWGPEWGVQALQVAGQPDTALTFLWVPMEFWARAVYPIEMIAIGGFVGSLIFAVYLSLAYALGKVNSDWVFSSQRIADYKCFLRLRFEPDKLTIYPICLDSVPDRGGWRRRRNPQPGQALVEPKSPLRPRLIEGPIVIRPDDIPRPGEQLRPKQAQA